MWRRLGGSNDTIDETEALSSTIAGKLTSQIFILSDELDDMRGEIMTVRSLSNAKIEDLSCEIEKQRAINARLNGFLADAQQTIDRLEALNRRSISQLQEAIEKINELEALV
jgi:uncharacterized coiled-coil protein SlyX